MKSPACREPGALSPGRSCARLLGALALGAALLGAGACSKPPSESADRSGAAPTIRKDVYTVRGIVESVPAPGAHDDFQVRHEAIPSFRQGGTKLGMPSMAMPFPLADGLSLGEIKKGDKIELTFEVDFDTKIDRPVGYRATAVRKLPDDTVIRFSLDASGPKPGATESAPASAPASTSGSPDAPSRN